MTGRPDQHEQNQHLPGPRPDTPLDRLRRRVVELKNELGHWHASSAATESQMRLQLAESSAALEAARQRIARDQELYQLAARAAGIGNWNWDIHSGKLEWTDTVENIFGLQPQQFDGQHATFMKLVHPGDRRLVEEATAACLDKSKDYKIQHRIIRPDGEVRWVSETGNVVRDQHGKALRMLGIVQDVTEQRLREEREWVAMVRALAAQTAVDAIKAMPDGVVLTDRDGKVVSVNPAMEILAARDSEKLIGLTLAEFMAEVIEPSDQPQAAQFARDLMQHFTGEPLTLHLAQPGGNSIPVIMTASCIRDTNGEPTRVLVSLKDISALVATQDHLRQNIEKLSRVNADLERFHTLAAHHLQEPLRQIVTFAQLLERRHLKNFDPQAHEILDHIVGGTRRMSELLTDLQKYEQYSLESLKLGRVDCHKLVQALIKERDQLLTEHKVAVTCDSLPVVQADSKQLRQLFTHLIDNSLRYRRDVPLRIEIKAECRDKQAWHFSFTDNGRGIAPEYHRRVFLLFERLENAATTPGTGIGLALCQRIVGNHGGNIWLDSTPNHGTTVHFELPRQPAHR